MGKQTTASSAALACPHCGAAMVAQPAAAKASIIATMVSQGSPRSYAENFAEQHLAKEAAHGVVHVCTGCRYIDRVQAAV